MNNNIINIDYTFLYFSTTLILYSARSTKGILRLSSAERSKISLSDEVKEILIGILLGDAHLNRRSDTANSRLVYGQTTKHKEYFDLVYNIFKPFCVSDHKPYFNQSVDKRNNEKYYSFHFATMQLPCFNLYREIFYNLGNKIIPNDIYKLLTPRGLAFWIMDDGSRQGEGLHISAYAFSEKDIDKLMFTLQDKFDLKCSIHYNRDNKPRIYIFKESMNKLRSLVSEYFIKEMLYKINL